MLKIFLIQKVFKSKEQGMGSMKCGLLQGHSQIIMKQSQLIPCSIKVWTIQLHHIYLDFPFNLPRNRLLSFLSTRQFIIPTLIMLLLKEKSNMMSISFMVKCYLATAEFSGIFLLLDNSHLFKRETKLTQYPQLKCI